MHGRHHGEASVGASDGLAQQLHDSFRVITRLIALTLSVTVVVFGTILLVFQPRVHDYFQGGRAAERVHEGMLDQETGLRGFLLTADPDYLQPFQDGREQVQENVPRMVAHLSFDRGLRDELIQLQVSEESWSNEWAGAIGRGNASGDAAFFARGKQLFDAYRRQHSRLSTAVDQALDRTRRAQRNTLAAGGAAEVVLCAGMVAFTRRRRRRLHDGLVAPVHQLLGTMAAIRDGDLSARPAQEGPLELRNLAAAMGDMAGAVERAHLAEAEGQREATAHSQLLARVLDVTHDLSSTLDVDEVVSLLACGAASLSGAERAVVWLHDPEHDRLVATFDTVTGGAPSVAPLVLDDGSKGRAARFGRAIAVRRGDGPSMALPMIAAARTIGVVELIGDGVDELAAGAVEALDTLVSHAASVVEAARLHQATQELSERDALTGLLNRRRLDEDLRRECVRSTRYGSSLALLMIDVDNFKTFNDDHGHQQGDEALRELAAILTGELRSSDTVYRYGGEEFAVMLVETPLEGASEMAERLRSRIVQRLAVRFGGDAAALSASIGVAAWTPRRGTPSELMAAADGALYEAKRTGRNRVVVAGEVERRSDSVVSLQARSQR